MMTHLLSRRKFLALTGAGALGAIGCHPGSRTSDPDPPSSTVEPWNLREIWSAIMKYEAHHGHFPPPHIRGPDGTPWHSWRVLILPFLGEEKLFAEYRFDEPDNGPNNSQLLQRMPPVYAYRDSYKPGITRSPYLAAIDDRTMWPFSGTRKRSDIRDPLDQTILVVELGGGSWLRPYDLGIGGVSVDRPYGWWPDPEVITVAGTIHRLRRGMSREAVQAALTVAGGEPLEECEVGWKLPGEEGLPER
jgi:hypothetical protein